MTWKVFEEAEKRYQSLRRRLSDGALAHLERRGFDVRDKSMREIKKLIALHRSKRAQQKKTAPDSERDKGLGDGQRLEVISELATSRRKIEVFWPLVNGGRDTTKARRERRA